VTKLLAIGKTDLLDGFVSNRTKRKFKAMLFWDEKEGKVGFEFAPRGDGKVIPARKAAAKTAATKTAPAKKAARKKAA
jgi:DNA topoisomerase-3